MSTLLLLHGFLGAPSSWDGVVQRLGIPEATAIVRPTLPGHGLPAADPEVFHDPARAFEAAIHRLVQAIPENESAVVAGYSMGARLALGIAARYPERVSGLILVGVNPGLTESSARAQRQRWDDEQETQLRADGLAEFLEKWEQMPLFETQRALPPAILAVQRAVRLAHDSDSLAVSMSALGLGRQPDFSSGLTRPATLLAGALDTKFAFIHARLAALWPGTRTITVEGAGHNLLLEAPGAVADAIKQMIQTPSSAALASAVLPV